MDQRLDTPSAGATTPAGAVSPKTAVASRPLHRAPVLAGRVYELRMLLHREGGGGDAPLALAEIGLSFHAASGAPLDPRLAGVALQIPHLAPLAVETLPSAPETDALRAAGLASRFLIPPPEAVELRLELAARGVVAALVELAPMAVAWCGEGGAVEERIAEAACLRADLLARHLPAGSCPPGILAQAASIPAEQAAAIRSQFAPTGDWTPVLARLASDEELPEAADLEERIARRAALRAPDAPRVAFVGSARTHARLRCLASVFVLREAHWRAQLDALALDRIVVETAAETVPGDWRGAFASLSGALPEGGVALCEEARARGIPLCLLVTAGPGEMPVWRGLAARADAVAIEGDRAGWPVSGPGAPPEGAAFVRRATEPMANPALRAEGAEGRMLVPVASDAFQHPGFAALLQRPTSYATLMSEFHYGFAPKALDDRLAPSARPAVPRPSRAHAVALMQAASLVLLHGRSLRSNGEMVDVALDAIAAGAIPVVHGPTAIEHPVVARLDRVWNRIELQELERLYRIPWLRERRWRTLLREVCRHHVWTSEERRAVLGADPLPEGHDAPLASAVMISKRPHLLEGRLAAFRGQTAPARELIVVLNTDEPPAELPDLREDERVFVAPESWSIGRCLNMAIAEARGLFWAKMDDDDDYSVHYLEELGWYYRATEADAIGRQAVYFHFEGEDRTLGRLFALDRCFGRLAAHPRRDHASGATLSARLGGAVPAFSNTMRNAADSSWNDAVHDAGCRFVCYDSTSITVRRGADESAHTWRMSGAVARLRLYQEFCAGNLHEVLDAPGGRLRG